MTNEQFISAVAERVSFYEDISTVVRDGLGFEAEGYAFWLFPRRDAQGNLISVVVESGLDNETSVYPNVDRFGVDESIHQIGKSIALSLFSKVTQWK